jgi:hypothetical protein
MSNNYPSGEVYGSKALTLAIIGMSALILMGALWSPAPPAIAAANKAPAAQIEQVVVTAPHTPGAAG